MENDSIVSTLTTLADLTPQYGAEKMEKMLSCVSDIKTVADKHGQDIFCSAMEMILDLAKKELAE